MTVQSLGDDSFDTDPWTVPTPNRLSGSHYVAWHVSSFHWILSRIEVSLRLPCISFINITLLFSYFFIFCWNTLSERIRHTCQRPLRSVVVFIINAFPPFTNYLGKYSLFHKSLFLSHTFYFPRLYTPVTPSRPVRVLGFVVTCRQCLVCQVIS